MVMISPPIHAMITDLSSPITQWRQMYVQIICLGLQSASLLAMASPNRPINAVLERSDVMARAKGHDTTFVSANRGPAATAERPEDTVDQQQQLAEQLTTMSWAAQRTWCEPHKWVHEPAMLMEPTLEDKYLCWFI